MRSIRANATEGIVLIHRTCEQLPVDIITGFAVHVDFYMLPVVFTVCDNQGSLTSWIHLNEFLAS